MVNFISYEDWCKTKDGILFLDTFSYKVLMFMEEKECINLYVCAYNIM